MKHEIFHPCRTLLSEPSCKGCLSPFYSACSACIYLYITRPVAKCSLQLQQDACACVSCTLCLNVSLPTDGSNVISFLSKRQPLFNLSQPVRQVRLTGSHQSLVTFWKQQSGKPSIVLCLCSACVPSLQCAQGLYTLARSSNLLQLLRTTAWQPTFPGSLLSILTGCQVVP